MAITKAIPALWSAAILDGFQRVNTWQNLIMDLSNELPEGNTLKMVTVSSGVTVGDYSGANINPPEEMTDVALDLLIDQKKYFNIRVDDVDKAQAKPDMLRFFSLQASRAISKTFDMWAYSVFTASFGSASKMAITVPIADPVTDAMAKALVVDLNSIITKMQKANWPMEAVFMVLNAQSAEVLRHFFIMNGVGSGVGADAVVLSGIIGRFFGMSVVVDVNIPDGSGTGSNHIVFGTSDCMSYVRQIAQVEFYRPELLFSDAIKGLYVYGGVLTHPTHRFALQQA